VSLKGGEIAKMYVGLGPAPEEQLTIAGNLSPGTRLKLRRVLEGRLKFGQIIFSRSFGTRLLTRPPGDKSPGYYRIIPSGFKKNKHLASPLLITA
jgi:hypothetical protein